MQASQDPALEQRLQGVRNELARANAAAAQVSGTGGARLMAVGKTFGPQALLAAARAGQTVFGENYAQEGCDKVDWFAANHPELKLEWHFIGPLQSNKTRPVAGRFDWVDSIDREKTARRLNDQRPAAKGVLNVLIEVNIDGEDSKSGVAPEDVAALAQAIAAMPRLRLRGLMCIPAPADSIEDQRKPLLAMRALFDSLKERFALDTLSMGMSADMAVAVECGSTLVRVGSAIFGPRHYPAKPAEPAELGAEKTAG